MKNNLSWLREKKELSLFDLGKQIFPDMPTETEKEKHAIASKVSRICKSKTKAVPFDLFDPLAKALDSDYNEMFGFNE